VVTLSVGAGDGAGGVPCANRSAGERSARNAPEA